MGGAVKQIFRHAAHRDENTESVLKRTFPMLHRNYRTTSLREGSLSGLIRGAFAFSTERATKPVNAQAREIGTWAFFVYPQDLLGLRVQTRVSPTSLFRGFAIS